MPNFEAMAGDINLPSEPDFHNEDFGYEVWEGVVDPERPLGPRGLVMRVPPRTVSKVWQLVQPGYHEQVKLLSGSGTLVVYRGESKTWATTSLTPDNPTGGGVKIRYTDLFCLATDDEEAWVMSRPSRRLDAIPEEDVTKHPEDDLSRFILAMILPINDANKERIMEARTNYWRH
jgi:hypothetical protein